MLHPDQYKLVFDNYRKTALQIQADVFFWNNFLSNTIKKYKVDYPSDDWLLQTGLDAYNVDLNGSKHIFIGPTYTVEIDNLDLQKSDFFTWVMNLSVARIYNSVELLLLQCVQLKYFAHLADPANGKKEVINVSNAIDNFYKTQNLKTDKKNNRHIISFLMDNSSGFNNFLSLAIDINLKTNWKDFFEFFSLLRNVITHHGMVLTTDVFNTLKSVTDDAFNYYFSPFTQSNNGNVLKFKSEAWFSNFLDRINDFSTNSIKFISEENDLTFLGLKKF